MCACSPPSWNSNCSIVATVGLQIMKPILMYIISPTILIYSLLSTIILRNLAVLQLDTFQLCACYRRLTCNTV